MSFPTTDELGSVIAAVISSDRDAESIRTHTGLPWETVHASIADLLGRGLLRRLGQGRYHVTQSLCAGHCSRGGRGMEGQEVVINPRSLRWTCASCWDASEQRRP
jgi:hypothetical protein